MITIQDLIDRFGKSELAQRTNRNDVFDGTVDEVVIERAINDAEGELGSYLLPTGLVASRLGSIYYVPSLSTPDVLIAKACDIARYYLYDDGVTDIVQTRYDQAIKWLKQVQVTPTMLTGAPSAASTSATFVIPNTQPNYWRDD